MSTSPVSLTHSFQYGEHLCKLETSRIARQATGAVLISLGDTTLLATAVGKKEPNTEDDFFPLTVNYQEKSYAVGKVPGGYFKREGRPTEKETLTSRLIDRPLRPLFPKGFSNEVQITVTLMSLDPAVSADIPAIIGTAAALAISGIPFNGPLAAARVGYQNGSYVLNPSRTQLETSALNLVVAGTQQAVLMVESEADQLSEQIMLDAVLFGHEQSQVAIQAIADFAAKAGKPSWDWQAPTTDTDLENQVVQLTESDLRAAYQIQEKQQRVNRIAEINTLAVNQLSGTEAGQPDEYTITTLLHDLEKRIVRQQILAGEPRIDGRGADDVRPITAEVGLLPRVHGSAVFTRGETQAIAACTLGTERDAQLVDDLEGEYRESFMMHYNFPPFSVGETGFMGGPKRREIGHGKLAKRALQALVPHLDHFPYVIRIVSEITESNGSSSMASVCGASLALMDAGVPIKHPVSGIAMGLIKEGDRYAVLSDILSDEDHLGDMDFKVAGTQQGITALQMDIKIEGITREIMDAALTQAKQGRLHILGKMLETLQLPRQEVSQHAPRIVTMTINPNKIRDLIGKGGATIRELTEQTNTTINVNDEGVVKIAAIKGEDSDEAVRRIERLTADVIVGQVYTGRVVKIVDFGAFVEILPGREGLLHISQIVRERVNSVRDYLQEEQMIQVKVTEIDRQGRIRLTMIEVEQE